MAQTSGIWGPFNSPKPSATLNQIKSANFQQALWNGIPNQFPIRSNVWRLARESLGCHTLPLIRPNQKSQLNVEEKIHMELNSEGCFSQIGFTVDDAAVEFILVRQAQRMPLDDYMPGSAQLAALILSETHGDKNEALMTLIALSTRVAGYFSNSHVNLRCDCLALAELIVNELPALADHFHSVSFDVVDLTDMVCVWAGSIFVYAFPRQFVLRMIDLIIVLGTSAIFPVMFGFFSLFANDLTVLYTLDAVFDFLNTVPATLTVRDVDSIFRVAQNLFAQGSKLSKLRSEKDWIKTVDHEGIPVFEAGFFPKSSTSTSTVKVLSAQFESQQSSDSFPRNPNNARPRSSHTSLDGAFFETPQLSNDLQSKLMASETQIKLQASKIERLEKQILLLEGKSIARTLSSVHTSKPSDTEVKSALVKELRSKQESFNTETAEPSLSSVAIRVDSSTSRGQDRFRSFSFSQMNEVFSKIYTLLEFPCVYIEGYLMKLSRAGLFGRQVLNQRWFVLKGCYLTYYKSADHSKPQKDRCMNVRGLSLAAIDDHPKGEFAFTITCRQEQYILFAANSEERNRWMASLQASVTL
uniref:PH domain-containing protein n=1 Tax=Spongospora subterranea TaxID=70186 RepID=A0A0H5R9V0_9EUKA|eukprot:CRZ10868.1 hypothetical protein [Spongospora subterranea]